MGRNGCRGAEGQDRRSSSRSGYRNRAAHVAGVSSAHRRIGTATDASVTWGLAANSHCSLLIAAEDVALAAIDEAE